MSKRITFVNTFEPPFGMYEAVFPELRRTGWQPTALVCNGNYRNGTPFAYDHRLVWVPPVLRSRKRWCHLSYYGLAPFAVSRGSSDAYVFISAPPLFYSLAPWLCSRHGTPYVLHVMDVYPALLARLGIISSSGVLYRRLWSIALRSFEKAHGIVTLGRCMANLLARHGVDPEKLSVVSNWTHITGPADQTRANPFRTAYGLDDRFIVLYSGNLGAAHEFRTLIRAARELEGHSDIVFVIIGRGRRHKEILDTVAEGASNILLLDYQPRDMLPYVMTAGNVHFISLRAGYEGLMVPSKFYSALHAARPVLYEGRPHGEVALEIAEFNCGRIIPPGDVDALVQSILTYANDTEAFEAAASAARKAHADRHDPATCASNYARLLTRLLGGDAEWTRPVYSYGIDGACE